MRGTQVGRISFKCLPARLDNSVVHAIYVLVISGKTASSLRKERVLQPSLNNPAPRSLPFLLSPRTHSSLHLLTLDRAGLARAEGSHCCAMNPLRRVTAERQLLRRPPRISPQGREAGFYHKPHRTGAKGRAGKAGDSRSARGDADSLSLLFTRLFIPSPER